MNGVALAIPSDEDKIIAHALMSFVERHHVTMFSGFPYMLMEMNHLPYGKYAYLMNGYTKPVSRRQGIGDAVVHWLIGQSVQRDITKIYLETLEKVSLSIGRSDLQKCPTT